jgi:hypothetical protein
VVAGAPGTGKSHTIAAMACDALGRGQSVLVAAKADATVDALLDLFERAPGLDPIVFGSNERKDALAARLAAGQIVPVPEGVVDDERDRLASLVATRDSIYRVIAGRLRAEEATDSENGTAAEARARWPMLFDADVDLDHVGSLLAVASHVGGGWLTNWRRQHATDELDRLTGARSDRDRGDVSRAYLLARAEHDAGALTASGGLEIGRLWTDLLVADDAVRAGAARWLTAEVRSEDRLTARGMASIAALATALRSGRAARREQLSHLDDSLTKALPLWVGTLADIEDLLPRACLFDVVILDEASSIDQPLAAPALLRARRGVIVGDPRQLRHVSFASDQQRTEALARNGIDAGAPMALKLDVRRNSTFDVAAGVAPVQTLDEHFRCAPHLVDFVARRLYDGRVRVATRSPETESIDCVDVVRVAGTRDKNEVVAAEVDEVISRLQSLRDRGARSVGVITPFRAQADAIEAAVLRAFTADELEALDLRVGTVHAFQGNERDIVIASLGVGDDNKPGSWRFVQDPHLFTVLATRARRRFTVIHAGDPPARGVVADYLAQADAPPGPTRPAASLPAWPTAIARDLAAAGVAAVPAYPSGRHVIDVCVGAGNAFFGLECSVHPEGADAHIERHLALHRTGWNLREAFESRWSDRRGELLVELSRH